MDEVTSVGPTAVGYAPVNGVEMYWESRGSGTPPLVVTHGGFGTTSMLAPLLDQLAQSRQVVAVELQGHGHTRDTDRPFSYEAFGDDIAALIRHLDLDPVDLLGNSLGGGASLRATIQHPELVRRLALVSAPWRRDAWFPEVLAGMEQVSRAAFEQFKQAPMYAAYAAVAPDVDAFPALMDKTGELLRTPYDWTDEVKAITAPTLLVFADADSVPTARIAEFFGLLGGGLRDGNFDGSSPSAARLSIVPNTTHYNLFGVPHLAPIVTAFLDEPDDLA